MIRIRFLTLVFVTLAGFGLCACETMEGAGQDMENAGEAVQDAAN